MRRKIQLLFPIKEANNSYNSILIDKIGIKLKNVTPYSISQNGKKSYESWHLKLNMTKELCHHLRPLS
jgi:hypothetical protein